MPVRTRASQVVVVGGEGGESHLKITLELELNINLNSNGLQATVSAKTKDVETIETKAEDEGFGGFVIPTFEPTEEKIDFGKKVEVRESAFKRKTRQAEEEN